MRRYWASTCLPAFAASTAAFWFSTMTRMASLLLALVRFQSISSPAFENACSVANFSAWRTCRM